MADSNENRVASSKTTRGSQDPNRYAGHTVIVQPEQRRTQNTVTVAEVNRVLEVGRLLRAVLTASELENLQMLLGSGKERQREDEYRQRDLVTVLALDAPKILKDI